MSYWFSTATLMDCPETGRGIGAFPEFDRRMQFLRNPEFRFLPARAIDDAPGRIAHQPPMVQAILVRKKWLRVVSRPYSNPRLGTQKMSSLHAQICVPATRLLSIIRAWMGGSGAV